MWRDLTQYSSQLPTFYKIRDLSSFMFVLDFFVPLIFIIFNSLCVFFYIKWR